MSTFENHPLQPFYLPKACLLLLGVFPPPRNRWSMDFYYPNFQNDMWRIFGWVFFGDSEWFVVKGERRFCRERIEAFLCERGIALGDAALRVVRQRGNASDRFLNVVEPFDLKGALQAMPQCKTIAVTGEKACDTLLTLIDCAKPVVGVGENFCFAGRTMRLYRLPSSSRAYPKPLTEKAAVYRAVFEEIGLL